MDHSKNSPVHFGHSCPQLVVRAGALKHRLMQHYFQELLQVTGMHSSKSENGSAADSFRECSLNQLDLGSSARRERSQ
jgi:hypothetical protein